MTDLLTGLFSRHQLHISLPELAAAAKPARPLSLLLLKLRDFELWQGRLTPLAADHLLQMAADLLRQAAPPGALPARWNNAIFALLLPNTPTWQAETLAEEIREAASQAELPAIFDFQGLRLDFCFGTAATPPIEHTRLPAAAEEQLRHSEGGIFAELMFSSPPLPDTPALNAYIHLASRYLSAGDAYLRRHCQTASSYALEVARRLRFSPGELNELRIAATLADIAMAETAGPSLNKPGPLTLSEYRRIQRHPLLAAQFCTTLGLPQSIAMIVRYHHELADGSGYPEGLTGEKIPLAASVLGASSAFAAMMLPRPYRPARKHYAALNALRRDYWPEPVLQELRAII
jgi:HD-GYP domain-containing protein (c-di-GMP phosphodiesterase class II)